MLETLRTSRLEIVDPKSDKVVATLQANQGGAGLWLEGPNGDTIAIYALGKESACIGIYDKDSKTSHGSGMPLALTVANGEAVAQFRDSDGHIQQIKLEEIKAAVAAHNQAEESALSHS